VAAPSVPFAFRSSKPVLVIGGGIAGMTTALELAEAGCEVLLVEKAPYLGGRVARTSLYFPKLCPPDCGLEINFKRLKNNPGVQILNLAEVESLSGEPGNYEATIKIRPRYVSDACTACGDCVKACPVDRPDDFNDGLSKTKAVYLPYPMAFPAQYVIDRSACREGCRACADACQYGAIDLAQQENRQTVRVSAVVAATGWAPYDASKLETLGYGKFPNVVTNVMLERMAAANGPTGGKILRPSDGLAPKSVAFAQCAGSRDENHLPYCSAVCCPASLKHTTYILNQYPNAQVTVFYTDIRTMGRLESFFSRVVADGRTQLIKARISKVEEDAGTGDLLVAAEDIIHRRKIVRKVSLLVLAVGMVPQTSGLPAGFVKDQFGFVQNGSTGLVGAGCARWPTDVSTSVRDATGAALRAFQCAVRSAQDG
jgi:quinone-modifying oxidoreductase subunit QmoA